MSFLTDKLRGDAEDYGVIDEETAIAAADEIERLRAEIAELTAQTNQQRLVIGVAVGYLDTPATDVERRAMADKIRAYA